MTPINKIRQQVAVLANRLNKKLKNLSASFKKAWAIVKGRQIISKVSGVVYGTRQKALRKLETYNKENVNVALEREADNKYDMNAVKVMVSVREGDKYNLGYIPKDLAEILAPLMDKGIQLISKFNGVTGGFEGCETYGALIAIEM